MCVLIAESEDCCLCAAFRGLNVLVQTRCAAQGRTSARLRVLERTLTEDTEDGNLPS